MPENRKIKNAKNVLFDGINFKSSLEASVYKIMKNEGYDIKYEDFVINLLDGFIPNHDLYIHDKRKNKLTKVKSAVRSITYTPDFTLQLKNVFFIIEVKGYMNDVYPIKRKLLFKWISSLTYKTVFFEVKNKSDVMDMINIIKSYE